MGVESFNAFIMMGIDEPPKGDKYLQVSNPCSYKPEGIELVYVGEFSTVGWRANLLFDKHNNTQQKEMRKMHALFCVER